MTLSSQKKALWISMSMVALWAYTVENGTRLPYLYTDFSWKIRLFFLFPLLLAILTYYGIIKKQSHGETGLQKRLSTYKTMRGKFLIASKGIAGLLLITGTLAWTSIAFPAILTNRFAIEPFVHSYKIKAIQERSGPVWSTLFDLELYDFDPQHTVTLRLKRGLYEQYHWQRGETICVIGRTSFFGKIIDFTTREINRCNKE